MTQITIAQENPLSDDGQALITGSEMAIREVYSADECFTLSPDELAQPNITFLVARDNGQPVGCVALVDFGRYGEVKRLFVAKEGRGKGIAMSLMQHLENLAIISEIPAMRLETGPKLSAAVALYRQRGYQDRDVFGDYQEHPASLFMEKTLSEPS